MFRQAEKILNDKYLSEDAVHQAFIRIIKNLHKIDENNCPRTRNFLVIICVNVAKDIYRERLYLNKSGDAIEELEDKMQEISNDPLDIIVDREIIHRLKDAIKNLNPIYRDVVLLKQSYNCTNEEICDLLRISPETLKKRLYRAKKMLTQILEKEGFR